MHIQSHFQWEKLPDFSVLPALLTWRQDSFPACWILIGQFKFPTHQPYVRNPSAFLLCTSGSPEACVMWTNFPHNSQKINFSFHNSREIKSTFHDPNLRSLWYLKSYAQSTALLDVFIIRPLSCSARIKKKSKQEHKEGWLPCHGHAILLINVEKNRRQNQNHGSQRARYFFLISRKIIFRKSRFTASNEITIHEKKQTNKQKQKQKQKIKPFYISREKKLGHSRITKIPFTCLCKWSPWDCCILYRE